MQNAIQTRPRTLMKAATWLSRTPAAKGIAGRMGRASLARLEQDFDIQRRGRAPEYDVKRHVELLAGLLYLKHAAT